ncbi:MAG: ribonuclease E/G, partial [Actinomycetes bacterium]
VLRRLTECLGRDRTKHQVAEVTSLGLVQMTRKRIGQGLLEAFSEPCEHCNGRGVKVHLEPVEARTGLRHSGENVDRVERVARAAKAGAHRPADGGAGDAPTDGAEGKATTARTRRSRAKSAAAAPEATPADPKPADSMPAARPRRRATKAQGAPTPVG